MNKDLEALAQDLEERLTQVMGRVGLTASLIDEHGPHLARLICIDDGLIPDPDGALKQAAQRHTQLLYEATSPWPPATIGMVAVSYMNLKSARRESTQLGFLKALIKASWGLGYSHAELELCLPRNIGIAREMVERVDGAKKREQLALAGREGGESKSVPFRHLKNWAVTEAKEMTGSSKQIARQLVLRIPPNLREVSIDPERVIYEALLAATRNKAKNR